MNMSDADISLDALAAGLGTAVSDMVPDRGLHDGTGVGVMQC